MPEAATGTNKASGASGMELLCVSVSPASPSSVQLG